LYVFANKIYLKALCRSPKSGSIAESSTPCKIPLESYTPETSRSCCSGSAITWSLILTNHHQPRPVRDDSEMTSIESPREVTETVWERALEPFMSKRRAVERPIWLEAGDSGGARDL